MKVQKIRFNGEDFILTSPEDDDSPIATIESFQAGECSFAHVYKEASKKPDAGKIMRFGKQIGAESDVELGEFIEIDLNVTDYMRGIVGDSWNQPPVY